jgi:hypothetical protein
MDGATGAAERTYTLTALSGDALTIELSGSTHWRSGTGSDNEADEDITGTEVIGLSDVLARSGHVTYTEHLGELKALVEITLGP